MMTANSGRVVDRGAMRTSPPTQSFKALYLSTPVSSLQTMAHDGVAIRLRAITWDADMTQGKVPGGALDYQTGPICQISSAYSRMARSEENLPQKATLRQPLRAKLSLSRYSRLTWSFLSR